MARPRSFDADEVLRRVYATFRDHGYSGTSLDEIAASTGLARPSLYAAFGDKRAMYLKSLALVLDDLNASADRLEATGLPLVSMLELWFEGVVRAYTSGDKGPGGCLAINTAAVEAVTDPEIRAALDRVLRVIDERVAGWFSQAGDPAPKGKAAIVAALMHSLALRARAGQPPKALTALWRAALPSIVG